MDTPHQHTPRILATRSGFFWLLLTAAAALMAVLGVGHALDAADNPFVAIFAGALPGTMALILAASLVRFVDVPTSKIFRVLEGTHVVLLVLTFVLAFQPVRDHARELGMDGGAAWVLPLLIYVVISLSILDLRRIRRTAQ